jgi:Pyridoxamine 5'-phosphate oxidase
MGRSYDGIDDRLRAFLEEQAVFFVGTAPLSSAGHVNVSPKGLRGSFVVLGAEQVAYLDLTGSGIETIAHLRENGRITLMFCAFDGPARIVRLTGRGRPIFAHDDDFAALVGRFPDIAGVRSIIVVDVDRVSDSCGFGVPRMELVGDRDQLIKWASNKGSDGLVAYRREHNAVSIDGLPGISF